MTIKEKKRTISLIWQFCTSKKVALWLIILLAFLSACGAIIPQESTNHQAYLEWAKANVQLSTYIERFQFNKIFKSYLFLILTIVFTLNIVCCTIEQIRRIFKIMGKNNSNLSTRRYPNIVEVKFDKEYHDVKKEVINLLSKFKYKCRDNNQFVFAEKGRFGIWGSVVFHIGLITIILGGLLSNYYSMSGYFQVSEGEVFQEIHEAYLPQSLVEAPLFNEATGHIGYQLKLDKQDRIYTGKIMDYAKSYVSVGEKDGLLNTKGIVERGQPFEYKGYTFYHKDSGFSPELRFKHEGKDIGSTYFSVETKEIGKTNHYTYSGVLKTFQNEGYLIKLNYYPDLITRDNGKFDYDSMEVKNPAIQIEVIKNGHEIFNSLVKKDQWVKFDKFEISLGNTVYWVGLDVVKDPGANILFLGFCISLIGLIVLYGIVHKCIYLEFREEDLSTICVISGFSRKYQLNFNDEFKDIINSIESMGVTKNGND